MSTKHTALRPGIFTVAEANVYAADTTDTTDIRPCASPLPIGIDNS